MQIVIDIDDNLYTKIFNNGVDNYNDVFGMVKAIRNGTPLLKGHGDLIDRDELLADSYCIDAWSGDEVNIVDVMTVKMADTIIEADKESEESDGD